MNVGIDIEQCDSLPAMDDPAANAFYADHFTPAEIDYCRHQANPRESFCGIWCAKEAVMKCGEEFLKLQVLDLEIGHDSRGRPFLAILQKGKAVVRSDCIISISHTRGLAVAVCVVNAG